MSTVPHDASALRKRKLDAARQCARDLLRDYGVDTPDDIEVERFCTDLGVRIVSVALTGCDAQLVRGDRSATIMLADRIVDPAAQRFNLAHELGHFLLGHPSRIPSLIPGPEAPRASLPEAEANAFAAELLMPEHLVRRECDLTRADLEGPQQIARNYRVSILASAIRFTELAAEPCAAVFSVAGKPGTGKVKWMVPSVSFARRIPRGRPLSPASLAWAFFQSGEIVTQRCTVAPLAWFDANAELDGELIEHAVCSTELRTVLSMLWLKRST